MGDLKARGGESASIRPFYIGGLTVDPEEGTISGPAGQVRVDPQVMAVLVQLTQSAGRIVSREDLLDQVWRGRVVSDDALTRCVYQLRQHLSLAGGCETYRTIIETLPKRGYRLNLRDPKASSRWLRLVTSSRWKVYALSSFAAGAALVGGLYWMMGHPDALVTSAAHSRALDTYLRANDYYNRADRHVALPFAVALYEQAIELDPRFVPAYAGLARTHTDLYWHSIDRTPARLEKAEETIRLLFALDPDLPGARLARANYLLKGLNRPRDALKELQAAEKSTPQEPELLFLQAMAYRRLGHWQNAVEALATALELDTGNITYLRQQFINYLFLRDYDRAGRILDRVIEFHPDDGTAFVDRVLLALCRDGDTHPFHSYGESVPSPYYDDGVAYTYTSWLAAIFDRDYEAALRILDSSPESQIFDGDFRNASFGPKVLFYARTYGLAGRTQQAREAYAEVVRLVQESSAESTGADDLTLASRYLALAEAQAGLGRRAAALESVRHAETFLPEDSDALMASALLLNSAVRVLVPAGYEEEALRALKAYLSHEGHWSIEGLSKDPRLELLSRSRGFKALEEQYARL